MTRTLAVPLADHAADLFPVAAARLVIVHRAVVLHPIRAPALGLAPLDAEAAEAAAVRRIST